MKQQKEVNSADLSKPSALFLQAFLGGMGAYSECQTNTPPV